MARTLDEKLNQLSADRRKRIEDRAAELIDEELSLRELRKALELTQTKLAERLGIGQDRVSRLESRADMLLSTLQNYVEGLGGELELSVKFQGRRKIRLKSLREPRENHDRVA